MRKAYRRKTRPGRWMTLVVRPRNVSVATIVSGVVAHYESVAELDLRRKAVRERILLDVDQNGPTPVQLNDMSVGKDWNTPGPPDFMLRRSDVMVGEEVRRGALAAPFAKDEY